MKTQIIYLMRNLEARDPILVSESANIVGSSERTASLVGNEGHLEGKPHLLYSEYVKAEQIGENLDFPMKTSSVLICPSPKPEAQQTARHIFIGMARKYAKKVLGIVNLNNLKDKDKILLREKGLYNLADYLICRGLEELDYRKQPMGGGLVAQADYKWIVQKGFENENGFEHPKKIAKKGLRGIDEIVKRGLIGMSLGGSHFRRNGDYDVVLAVSHQPNLEIITAALTGELGNNAEALWENAGGDFLCGGIKLTKEYDGGKIISARLERTSKGEDYRFTKRMEVDIEDLNNWAYPRP